MLLSFVLPITARCKVFNFFSLAYQGYAKKWLVSQAETAVQPTGLNCFTKPPLYYITIISSASLLHIVIISSLYRDYCHKV